ncbi:MAG TPA: signal peptidase I [Dehalococcoidia bacterium]|nr:signal peptidase I [Dehalococcoidia bacterium]
MIETKPEFRPKQRHRAGIRELLETIVLALFIFLLVRSTLQNFKVEGQSMDPTLASGEFILVNKLIYQTIDLGPLDAVLPFVEFEDDTRFILRGPNRGDIVVFVPPINPGSDFIKRVIAEPGEVVEIRRGRVFIDGARLEEPYLESRGNDSYEACRVPGDHYFVMGDNRPNSSDSRRRDFGPIHVDRIVGLTSIIYWPLEDFGWAPNRDVEPSSELDETATQNAVDAPVCVINDE